MILPSSVPVASSVPVQLRLALLSLSEETCSDGLMLKLKSSGNGLPKGQTKKKVLAIDCSFLFVYTLPSFRQNLNDLHTPWKIHSSCLPIQLLFGEDNLSKICSLAGVRCLRVFCNQGSVIIPPYCLDWDNTLSNYIFIVCSTFLLFSWQTDYLIMEEVFSSHEIIKGHSKHENCWTHWKHASGLEPSRQNWATKDIIHSKLYAS